MYCEIYKAEQFSQNGQRKLSASRMRRDGPGILPCPLGLFIPYYEEPQYIPWYILYGTDVMVPKDLYSYYEGDLT